MSSVPQVLPLAQGLSAFLQDILSPATGLALIPSPGCSTPQHSHESLAAVKCRSAVLVGLLTDRQALAAAIASLDSMYGQLYGSTMPGAGEIDERLFISGAETFCSGGGGSGAAAGGVDTSSAHGSDSSGGSSAAIRCVGPLV